jgi:hypothetical protein
MRCPVEADTFAHYHKLDRITAAEEARDRAYDWLLVEYTAKLRVLAPAIWAGSDETALAAQEALEMVASDLAWKEANRMHGTE